MTASVRILALLSLLQNHRHWSGAELARRLEVSPRTLRRDVEQLRDLGYPVRTSRGVGGGYQLAPGGSLPPLVVDDEEAVAIVLGLRAAASGGIGGIAEAAARALAKVVAVLPGRLRRTAADMQAAIPQTAWAGIQRREADIGVLAVVAAACRDRETVSFSYRARDGAETARRAEPHALVPYGSRWYLVAFDLAAADWRSFRLDRIAGIAPGRPRFVPRAVPGGDPVAYVASGVATASARHRVEVTVDAPAERVRAEAAQWGEVTELARDRSRLVLHVDSFGWVAFILGSLDAPFTVHGPPELTDYLAGWAERLRVGAARTDGIEPLRSPGLARSNPSTC